MATYTIDIDENNSKAKHFLEFIRDYASDNTFIHLEKMPNATTRKAIDDAHKGKLTKVKSVNELFDSI